MVLPQLPAYLQMGLCAFGCGCEVEGGGGKGQGLGLSPPLICILVRFLVPGIELTLSYHTDALHDECQMPCSVLGACV